MSEGNNDKPEVTGEVEDVNEQIHELVETAAAYSRADDFESASKCRSEAAELAELDGQHVEAAGHYLGAADANFRALVQGNPNMSPEACRGCVLHAQKLILSAADILGKHGHLRESLFGTLAERKKQLEYWQDKYPAGKPTEKPADGK